MTCKRWVLETGRVWYHAHNSQGYSSACVGSSIHEIPAGELVSTSVYISLTLELRFQPGNRFKNKQPSSLALTL